MKLKKSNIRRRILKTFSSLLFLSFFSIGLIFNVMVDQYIRSSAITQLTSSMSNMKNIMAYPPPEYVFVPNEFIETDTRDSPQRNYFRIQTNAFFINSQYEVSEMREGSEDANEISSVIKEKAINLPTLQNKQIRTLNGTYYVSALNIDRIYTEDTYMVFYVDITSLSRFATSINMLLLVLVGIIWLAAIIILSFLSSSIAKPIRKLSSFASSIGQGNFSLNDFNFKDAELDSLNITLLQAAKQLTIYDNEQKKFFQNASHELRTPLMSIKCYAEGIMYGVMEPQKASRTILDETDRLTEMVDDLLYISKIDNITSSFTKEPVDLRDIVKSCAKQQQAVAQRKQINFIYNMDNTPVMFECTGKLIARAVTNLISNAIRYAESEISLSCQNKDNHIIISVADDGKGISNDAMANIFERFYKGDDGNHGIGLSIVKSIVEQHHGTVAAKNLTKGAEFIISFPNE